MMLEDNRFTLLPIPDADVGQARVADVTDAFREISPGRYEARLDLPSAGCWLRLSRVGCRAELEAEDEAGRAVRADHFGTYTDWDAPLGALSGGCRLRLSLAPDETTMSPYNKAGIFGRILLIGLPGARLQSLCARAAEDDAPDAFTVAFQLDPEGAALCDSVELRLSGGGAEATTVCPAGPDPFRVRMQPENPRRWSREDPFLYDLCVRLRDANGNVLAQYSLRTGLARVRREGDRLLLNGAPHKLLGLAYREPLRGEGFDPAEDLRLFQEANVNYLRSLFYPFSEAFLALCDAAGILVEQSAPVTGLGQSLPANQNAPALRPLFDRMYTELVLRDRSHPSVLLWSLGDDCVWGDQLRRGLAIARALNPSRPVNFHLPMTVPQDVWDLDVWSVHYSAWNLPADVCYDQMVIFHTQGAGNEIGYATAAAEGLRLPVLHDACALVPVYDLEDMDRDPGVHEFWGESVRRFADRFNNTPGALGGAVMAGADEDGSFHPSLAGYAWGVLDARHRPKSEYFHLKRAYAAPRVRLEKGASWRFEGDGFDAILSPETGLFTEISSGGRPVILGGPWLHTGRYPLGAWRLTALDVQRCGDGYQIVTEGEYEGSAGVRFTMSLSGSGQLHTRCEILSLSRPMPHRVKAGIGLDPGGLTEFGVAWRLTSAVSGCDFARRGLWDDYPEDHIGRTQGRSLRSDAVDFAAQKFHIISACVLADARQEARILGVLPCDDTSLRFEECPDPACVVPADASEGPGLKLSREGEWFAVRDDAGGIGFTEIMAKDAGCALDIAFNGTGIVLRGTTDRIRGLCDVELDGAIVASRLSQHTPAVYFPSMSRGYEKRFHRPLFAVDGLAPGAHRCRLLVRGEREAASQDNWISVESVEVLRPDRPRQVMMYVNRAVNYPRLVYGNFMNPPILIGPGDRSECRLSLVPAPAGRKEDAPC